ncbi:MAG: ComEC/Rec2 family competence protein, partial [Patescibacteria group bacterium]
YQKTYSRKGLLAGVLFLVFIFGIIRFNSFDLANSILNQFADIEVGGKGLEITLNGYIDDEPNVSGSKMSFTFKAKELVVPDETIKVDERTLVTVDSFPTRNYGNKLSVNGALKTPQNFVEDFDYITYLKKEGIRTVMSFPKITSERYDSLIYHNMGFFEKAKISLYKKIFGLKNKFELAINRSISEPNASFVNGILLGSRQNIPEKMKEAFNKTGTTHILAISGYNIMIISWAVLAGLVYFFKRRTAFWLLVAIIILFTILTGASSSVVRASIMGLLLLFANGYGRLYDPKNSIILAGAAMIYINPFALVFDIGFQLSFLAVMGLIYIYPFLDNKFRKIPELWKLKELTLMTISAQIAVAPLLIYYFHQFSPWSLPTNILVLPFVPFAMLIGFMSGIGGMIFLPLGKIVGWFAWAITTYQIKIIEFFVTI